MEHLVNQLEGLRAEANTKFGNEFTDGLYSQIYKEWHSIVHNLEMNANAKLMLMRMIELKWHCQFTFTVSSMSKDLKMQKNTVNLHLKKLQDLGLCKKNETGINWQITLNKVF